jgi:hypothetical protein
MGGSSAPALPPASAPPPTLEDPSVKTARDAELRANLLRRGRASTIVAGNTELGEAQVTKKTLLGS